VTAPDAGPRVTLVTGGSRGLGALLTSSLLKDGWCVVAVSRSSTDFVSEVAAQWPARFLWQEADLTDPVHARAVVKAAVSRFGRVDALVNNMGHSGRNCSLLSPRKQRERRSIPTFWAHCSPARPARVRW